MNNSTTLDTPPKTEIPCLEPWKRFIPGGLHDFIVKNKWENLSLEEMLPAMKIVIAGQVQDDRDFEQTFHGLLGRIYAIQEHYGDQRNPFLSAYIKQNLGIWESEKHGTTISEDLLLGAVKILKERFQCTTLYDLCIVWPQDTLTEENTWETGDIHSVIVNLHGLAREILRKVVDEDSEEDMQNQVCKVKNNLENAMQNDEEEENEEDDAMEGSEKKKEKIARHIQPAQVVNGNIINATTLYTGNIRNGMSIFSCMVLLVLSGVGGGIATHELLVKPEERFVKRIPAQIEKYQRRFIKVMNEFSEE